MTATRTAIVVVLAHLGLAGCGTDCETSCGRVFDESECGFSFSGVQPDDSRMDCLDMCEDALKVTGSVGGYDPINGQSPPQKLLNERQAALWMDCVEAVTCEQLFGGSVCRPLVPMN